MSFSQRIKNYAHLIFAIAAYWLYGRPARKMILIGVTGTKGKSTTCRFIASVLEAAGCTVGLMSSVEFQIGRRHWLNETKITMPGKGKIQRMLCDMLRAGCTHVIIETSSQGILQHRQVGLAYDLAVFTNLAPEHVEAHGGYERLRAAKGKLFRGLAKSPGKVMGGVRIPKTSIVNGDDTEAHWFLSFESEKKYAYGFLQQPALTNAWPVIARGFTENGRGSSFRVGQTDYRLALPGKFNAYNGLAAIAVGMALGITPGNMVQGLANVVAIPGRTQFVAESESRGFSVVVDYAHEPLSYTELLTTLGTLAHRRGGRLIAMIGGDGGGRDAGKRERMGAVAGRLADVVIVTDVDFYDEPPEQIAAMVAAGVRGTGKEDGRTLLVASPRREGVRLALRQARPGDVVALLGKGSETFIAGPEGSKIPWNDYQVAVELLGELFS